MIGTLLLAAAAAFLGWLFWIEPDPTMAGLFLMGAIVAAVGAVVWAVDEYRFRRLP